MTMEPAEGGAVTPPQSEPPGGLPPSPFRKPGPPPRPQTPEDEVPASLFTPTRAWLALGTLLVIAHLWYGNTGRSSSEKPKAPRAPAPASSPAPSQPPVASPEVPQLSAAERQAANDALEALRTLQSVTAGDIAFQDYMSRVLDTKNQVGQYLQAGGGDKVIKDRVYEAMTVHLVAAAAWRAKIVNRQSDYQAVGTLPAPALCPEIQPLLDLPPPTGVLETAEMNRGANLAASVDRLWSCAANKIADAEQALKSRSGEARR